MPMQIVKIREKDGSRACSGHEAIYTWEDVPKQRLQWQDRLTRNQARMTV